jgi:hypothetical protein
MLCYLVDAVGIEPTTCRLRAECLSSEHKGPPSSTMKGLPLDRHSGSVASSDDYRCGVPVFALLLKQSI